MKLGDKYNRFKQNYEKNRLIGSLSLKLSLLSRGLILMNSFSTKTILNGPTQERLVSTVRSFESRLGKAKKLSSKDLSVLVDDIIGFMFDDRDLKRKEVQEYRLPSRMKINDLGSNILKLAGNLKTLVEMPGFNPNKEEVKKKKKDKKEQRLRMTTGFKKPDDKPVPEMPKAKKKKKANKEERLKMTTGFKKPDDPEPPYVLYPLDKISIELFRESSKKSEVFQIKVGEELVLRENDFIPNASKKKIIKLHCFGKNQVSISLLSSYEIKLKSYGGTTLMRGNKHTALRYREKIFSKGTYFKVLATYQALGKEQIHLLGRIEIK